MINKSQNWEAVPGFDPSSGYIPLNLDNWLRDHKILEDGAARGANNQPASDIESLDGTEERIVAWINQRGRNCRDVVANYLSDVERQLADMDRDEDLEEMGRHVERRERNGKTKLAAQADGCGNDIAPKEEALRNGTRDLANFRQANRLMRQPDHSHRRRALVWIGGAFLFEVALNAALLTEVNTFGFIGSFGQMALISLLNVVLLGWAMGASVRLCHHVHVGFKGLASLIILVVGSIATAFNLLVGHFRDSMQAVANAPATEPYALGDDAVQRLLATPFAWDAFQSILLVLLGLAFFLLGAFEWLRRDDRYPGYGPKHRQLGKIQENYAGAYDQAQRALEGAYKQSSKIGSRTWGTGSESSRIDTANRCVVAKGLRKTIRPI